MATKKQQSSLAYKSARFARQHALVNTVIAGAAPGTDILRAWNDYSTILEFSSKRQFIRTLEYMAQDVADTIEELMPVWDEFPEQVIRGVWLWKDQWGQQQVDEIEVRVPA